LQFSEPNYDILPRENPQKTAATPSGGDFLQSLSHYKYRENGAFFAYFGGDRREFVSSSD